MRKAPTGVNRTTFGDEMRSVRCHRVAMDLLDYLRESPRPAADLARQVGIARSHIYHLSHGRRHPSAGLIDRITEATGGMVTHQDWALRRMLNPRPWANEASRD